MNPIIRTTLGRRVHSGKYGALFIRLIAVFMLICSITTGAAVRAQSSSMSFSVIPFSDPDIVAPFRGAEDWHQSQDFQRVSHPTESQYTVPHDVYIRSQLTWDVLEPTRNNFNWARIDEIFRYAIQRKQRVGFGIMTQWPYRENSPTINGASISYPTYLHNEMQALPVNERDWITPESNTWIPNYNSEAYLSRWENLLNNLANYINTATYNGVPYRHALGYVDIRGYGSWGEWHMVFAAQTLSVFPTGRRPQPASLIRIFDAHINAFPNTPLVSLMATFDANQLGNTMVPPEVGYHALTASNRWGKIGWRRDNWGWRDDYLEFTLGGNRTVYNGMRFDTAITNRSRYAPVLGEGPCGGTANGGPAPFWAIPSQVRRYGATMIGNGNFCGEEDASVRGRDSMRMAWKLTGYRIILEGGSTTSSISAGAPLNVTLQWRNIGVSPVYENWNVTYELQNQATNAVVWTGNSRHQLKLWQPSATATGVSDNYTLPSNLPAGTYRLVLKIVDPTGYRDPLPLAIRNRRADGSYLLRQDIVLSGGGPNTAPSANAGADQAVTLPTSSVTLSGSGSDPDGNIASYAWTKVSGPAGGNLQTANAASSLVTGLAAGTYVFRLTVTDNLGATATDEVQVVVTAAPPPPPNAAPVANAGPDRAITLPTNSTTLNGSATDADGTIATYRWSKVSGPAGGTIASPSAAATNITGLNAGTYVYRLTVTDNDGATDTDDATIVVNNSTAPSPTNQPPVANAGADRTITLPVNALTLTGTATDPDGSVATYAWSKVSGPAGGNIQSPNAASSQITAMIAGTYVYRLTVTDNNGALDTDDVQVVVNPAPAPAGNQAPIANAGSNIMITLPANAATLSGSGSDPDGTIAGYSWTKVSGPAGGAIQAPTAASTQVTGMIAGTYVFRLTVRDNLGATGTDDIQVLVNPAPVPVNQAPIANAGRDATITLPTDTIQLNGSGSRDTDGSVASYNWRKVSGPAGGTLSNPRVANPIPRGLMQGTYEFELLVTDNEGATHTDRISVTVIRINKRPVLATIDTVNVMLPVQNTELSAVDSYDPDGSITAYQWTAVSGPTTPRILNPRNARTVVADLMEGTYQFRIEATDNDGDRSQKAVVVIVSPNNGRRIVPEVDVFPNPASSVVNIQVTAELNGRTMMTFYDMNGRPVMTDVFTKATRRQTRQVNIARLPKGTYGVLIQVDQAERVVEKVIKF
jgi:hypothetical protein